MDLSAARARAESAMADFERLRANAGTVRERLLRVQGRGSAGGGMVRVVTDQRGRVAQVRIDPRVFRRPDSRALAEMIVTAAAEAAADADRQVEEAFAGLVPGGELKTYLDFDMEALFQRIEDSYDAPEEGAGHG